MVKSVIGEEARLKLAEDRLSKSAIPSQVGLVIGKLSSALDRGFVFDLVPTPPNDAGDPASSVAEPVKDDKKKGPKSKSQATADSSSLVIDKDWVAEHARQVSRMLTGGMKVIGIYVWVSESAFKNSTMVLCQTVKGVAEAAPFLETDSIDRLLIHIYYSPQRWTCRNCSLASNITSSSLRPCDFKMGKVFSSLQMFKCTYNFDLRFPICGETATNTPILTDVLRQGISVHARALKDAKAVIDGSLVVNDEPSTSNGSHEVELLLPFMNSTSADSCSQNDVLGVLVFSGSVCSFAYLNSKEPISQAVSVIKEDIITSLQSRLDIICDEADGDIDPSDGGDVKEGGNDISTGKPISQLVLPLLRETCSLSFPRRVFVPWLAGTFICDYLQASDTLEVVKDHCVELMSMEPPTDTSKFIEPETEVTSMITKSFWQMAAPFNALSASSSKDTQNIATKDLSIKSTNAANFSITAAILVLIISILIGCFIFLFR